MNRPTQPAMIAVAYNRPHSLARLLGSLRRANYADARDIALTISIDGSDNDAVYAVARDFEWPHGEKRIIRHEEHLGLRKHIISCGDLSDTYGSVLILEDDMYVGPGFYSFARQALEKYRDDAKVAGISLYSYTYNEFAQAPFMPISDGFDVYFMQVPSSLGQIWTQRQWEKFKAYYDSQSGDLIPDHRIPSAVFDWPTSTSWKKYLYKYMVDNDLYFVFPQGSHATNFGDPGTHFMNEVQFFQVPVVYCHKTVEYRLPSSEESTNKYDAYWEPEPGVLKAMGIELPFECEVDLYGLKNLDQCGRPYVVSIKPCREPQRSFGMRLMPLILNVSENIRGRDFAFAPREAFANRVEIGSRVINRQLQASGYLVGYREGRQSIRRSKYYEMNRWMLQLRNLIGWRLPFRRKLAHEPLTSAQVEASADP